MRQQVEVVVVGLVCAALLALLGGVMLVHRLGKQWRGRVTHREVIRHASCPCKTVQLTFDDGSVVCARESDDDDLTQLREGDVIVKRRGELGYSRNGSHTEWWGTWLFSVMAALGSLGLVLLPVVLVMLHRRSKWSRLPRALYLRQKDQ